MAGYALIVTDVQEGFTRQGNLASSVCTDAIPRIVSVVERAFEDHAPVIFTKDSHITDDLEFQMFPPHCIVGTPEHDLVAELKPYEGRAAGIIRKTRYSAFYRTDLEPLLRVLDVEEFRIAGFCTDICVLHTTADLRNRDLAVTVLSDACETFDAPGHDHAEVNAWALSHIEHVLGARVTTAALLAEA